VRTIEEKIWDYLVEHKRPVTSKQLAKYFIVSQQSVARTLGKFVEKQVVDKFYQGNVLLYKIKD
jgi:Mn-dependent DtxR family transcriptional regulator